MDINDTLEARPPSEEQTEGRGVNIEHLADKEAQPIKISAAESEAGSAPQDIQLQQLVKDKRGYVQTVKRELRVSVDHNSGNTIVAVVEGANQDVVRHIAQDEILAIERMITAPAGMLFRAQA